MSTTTIPEYKRRWIKDGAYNYAIIATSQSDTIFCANLSEVYHQLKKQSRYSTVTVFKMVPKNDLKRVKTNTLCFSQRLHPFSGRVRASRDYFISDPSWIQGENCFLFAKIKVPKKYLDGVVCRFSENMF